MKKNNIHGKNINKNINIRTFFILCILIFFTSCFSTNTNTNNSVNSFSRQHMSANEEVVFKQKIFILPFQNSSKINSAIEINNFAYNNLKNNLKKDKRIILIEDQSFFSDIKSIDKINTDMLKQADLLGITAFNQGSILDLNIKSIDDDVGIFRKIKAEVTTTLNLKILSTRSGKKLLEKKYNANLIADTTRFMDYSYNSNNLTSDLSLVSKVIKKAMLNWNDEIVNATKKVLWQGRIAYVNGDKIYLNVGKLSGLQIGDILKVTTEEKEIINPDTGFLIGKIPGRIKGTIEVIGFFGENGAIANIHSGFGFKKNDLIVVY